MRFTKVAETLAENCSDFNIESPLKIALVIGGGEPVSDLEWAKIRFKFCSFQKFQIVHRCAIVISPIM